MYDTHQESFWFSIVRIQGIRNDLEELNDISACHKFGHVSIATVYIDCVKSDDILYHLKLYGAKIIW